MSDYSWSEFTPPRTCVSQVSLVEVSVPPCVSSDVSVGVCDVSSWTCVVLRGRYYWSLGRCAIWGRGSSAQVWLQGLTETPRMSQNPPAKLDFIQQLVKVTKKVTLKKPLLTLLT